MFRCPGPRTIRERIGAPSWMNLFSPFRRKPSRSKSPGFRLLEPKKNPLRRPTHYARVLTPNISKKLNQGGHKRDAFFLTRFSPSKAEKLPQESIGETNRFLPQILTVFRLKGHRKMGFRRFASPSLNFLIKKQKKSPQDFPAGKTGCGYTIRSGAESRLSGVSEASRRF